MLVGSRMLTFIDRKICDIKQVLEPCNQKKSPGLMKGYLMSTQKSHNQK